eukprot:NODE_342_length_9153_cov_0.637376.p8 type:complete len:147 gc:universal NODE_342_length_9153_cov_0.637376:681-241(-)
MAPGVFGKTFYNFCNSDDVYSSNSATCSIVPLDVNHTYYIPSKTVIPTITTSQKTDLKWTTLKNATQSETQLDTQTVVLQVDATLVTRTSHLFRSYSYLCSKYSNDCFNISNYCHKCPNLFRFTSNSCISMESTTISIHLVTHLHD